MTWEQQLQLTLRNSGAGTPEDLARAGRMQAAFFEHVRLVAKVRLVLFSAVFVASLGAFLYLVQDTISEAGATGLTDVLHLAISDWSSVIAQWHSFALSLIDLLPVVSNAGGLIALVAMLVSIGYSVQAWNNARGFRVANIM